MDDRKLQPIRDYLQRELPDYLISEKPSPGSETQTFVISADTHSTNLMIQKSFIDHQNVHQIVDMLNRMNILFLFKEYPDINTFFVSCEANRI